MSKYYTPELEEFHIGFRFQHRDPLGELDWYTLTLLSLQDTLSYGVKDRFVEDFIRYNPTNIRVKHLDKSDIEGLGWKFDSKQSNELLFYKGHKSLTIFDKTYVTIFNEDDSICFDGQIKNYNELLKLQNMLGI